MSLNTHKEPVFYIDADKASGESHRFIENAVFDAETQAYKTPGGRSFEAMQALYPGLQVGDFDTIMKAKEAFYREQDIYEIDEEAYTSALECLPPVDWCRIVGGESFKMSERLFGNVTSIFCSRGQRYFRFYDDIRLNQEAIMQRLDQGIRAIDTAKAAAAACAAA